jgi:CubicO group peptidase (beta-lactamase class C family)
MKKLVSLMLCAALLAFAAGCSKAERPVSAAAPPPVAEPPQVSEAPPEPEPVSAPAPVPAPEPEPEPVILETPYTDFEWEFDSPENHGVDGERLQRFHDALETVEIRSFLLVRDGVVIDEYYKEGYDENEVFGFASCTKSVSGALIGLAIAEGAIESVDTTLPVFFPELAGTDKENITVEHMLGHVSGIHWREWAGGDYFRQLTRSDNWVEFVFSQPMEHEPGTVFNYTTGGSHILGAIIKEATGEDAYEFAVERLFKPLGMRSVTWRHDPQGITDGGNGIAMTARDAAKFGQLYLNGGKWGEKQVIPAEWVEESTSYQFAGKPGTGEYGYSWWLRTYGGLPAYYAMGHGGQYIIVMPGLELVCVMNSRLNDTYVPQYMFEGYVIPAVS